MVKIKPEPRIQVFERRGQEELLVVERLDPVGVLGFNHPELTRSSLGEERCGHDNVHKEYQACMGSTNCRGGSDEREGTWINVDGRVGVLGFNQPGLAQSGPEMPPVAEPNAEDGVRRVMWHPGPDQAALRFIQCTTALPRAAMCPGWRVL